MKIVSIAFAVLLTASSLFAQDNGTVNPFASAEVGSKSYYTVTMRSGETYKARIVSADTERAMLLLPGGNSLVVATPDVADVKKQTFDSFGSVGLGFGIPYGFLGANLDIKIFKVLYGTAGLGTGIFVNPMYNVGLKCYFLSGDHKFRPRAMVNYGTTGMISIMDANGESMEKGSFNGATVGAGFQWAMNITHALAFDCDLLYILDDSKIEERIDYYIERGLDLDMQSSGNFKFSLGLRYIF